MNLAINSTTLRFRDDKVEAAYRSQALPMTRLLMRIAIMMIVALFVGLASIGDHLAQPPTLENLNNIRFAVVAPITLGLFLLSFMVRSHRAVVFISFAAAMTVGGGQLAVTYYSGAELALLWHGIYAAIFFGTITMTGLNHISGSIACLSILSVHSFIVLTIHNLSLAHYTIEMTNLLSTILVAVVSNYLIGLQSRRHFVSEHKLSIATESLKTREKRLYTLYEYAPIAYASLNVTGCRVVSYNEAFKKLLGFSQQGEALVGTLEEISWSQFLPEVVVPNEQKSCFASLLKSEGAIVDSEVQLLRSDGGHLDVLLSAVPGLDEQGEMNEIRLTLVDISARKAAEQRFSALMESAPDAIMVSKEDGILVLINSRAEQVFGYPHNELLSTPIERLLSEPLVFSQAEGQIDRRLQGRRKNGSLFEAELSCNRIIDHQESLLVTVIHDITQRQADEDRLARNHRDMMAQTLINDAVKQAMTEAQLLADVCRILLEVHQKRLVWIGYRQSDKRCSILPMARFGYDKGFLAKAHYSWSAGSESQGPTGRAILHNEVVIVEDTVRDISFVPWRAYAIDRGYACVLAVPLVLKGETFGAITLYGEEVGEFDQGSIKNLQRIADMVANAVQNLRTKEARQAAEKDLKETEERGRLLLQSIDEGIFGLDIEGRVTFMNPAGARLLGWRDYELIGRKVHDLIHHSYADGAEYPLEACPMHKTCCLGESQYIDDEVLWRQDGNSFAAAYASRPITKDGELVGAVISFRDVSELKAVTADLEQAMHRAEESTQAKSDFLANMSHEIRTPMNAIIGLSHLLLGTELNNQQHNYLSKINGSATNLLGLINDILDFSAMEAGEFIIESTVFDLNEQVLVGLSAMADSKAEHKGLAWSCELAADVPMGLNGDAKRLSQVLNHLLDNAIKFTESGDVQLRISCEPKQLELKQLELKQLELKQHEQLLLRFELEDSGIGMSEDECKRLFQSFSQADSSATRKYGGAGLGLTICAELVALMQGEMGVDSTPGVGSTFWFTARLGYQLATAAVSQPLLPPPVTSVSEELSEELSLDEKAKIQPLIVRLRKLLIANDGDAIELLDELLLLLGNSDEAGQFKAVSRKVAAYEFEQALVLLNEVVLRN